MKALIIVDVQIDFTPGGSLAVPGGDKVVGPINRIQDRFDLVVATQDWHPPGHASFASNHEGRQPFEKIDLDGREQVLWPDHCVQGSKGAELHPELRTERIEAIIRKGMDPAIDSYSAFYDNGHLRSTGLAGYLREKGADDLTFCGLAGDICVYYTVKDALEEGFSATFVEDAALPLDEEEFARVREELEGRGVKFVKRGDL